MMVCFTAVQRTLSLDFSWCAGDVEGFPHLFHSEVCVRPDMDGRYLGVGLGKRTSGSVLAVWYIFALRSESGVNCN